MIERHHPSNTAQRFVTLMHRVYGWMTAGLLLTALVAYAVFMSPTVHRFLFSNPAIPVALLIMQLVLVGILGSFISRMSFPVAVTLFVLYAGSLGFSLSSIFFIYTGASIGAAFVMTAGMFAIMSLYGYYTDSDLTTMGNYLFMALVGIIISSLVNLFLASSTFNFLICIFGVIIFTLLTAYDTQRIRQVSQEAGLLANSEVLNKAALLGALTLYLDFVNLFLFILQLIGSGKRR